MNKAVNGKEHHDEVVAKLSKTNGDYAGKGSALTLSADIDPEDYPWKSVAQYMEWCQIFERVPVSQLTYKIRQNLAGSAKDPMTGN